VKIESAAFVYDVDGRMWHVVFVDRRVKLWFHRIASATTSPTFEVENSDRRWKPCQSHAMDLIRMHSQQPAASNQAAQRVAATRPVLRAVSEAVDSPA
jgi:hypothetical protein